MSASGAVGCSTKDMEGIFCSKNNMLAKRNGGSPLSKRIQETFEKFKRQPLPPPFPFRLNGPPATWEIFNRLQAAIAYADTSTKDCKVFAFEDKGGSNGERKFLVAHPQFLWHNHRSKQPEERCTYEVIRENDPCKLYFDLEFYTAVNNVKDGNEMTNIFIKCVIAHMYEQYKILFTDSDFLWLDASNQSKFSSHLILQMVSVAFKNNIEAGIFVSSLTSHLRKRIESNASSDDLWPSSEEIKSLLVKSKKDKVVFFYDEGVYTKNRNFRMYLSTKYNKNYPLILSMQNKYDPLVCPQFQEESIFYDSLITFFRNENIKKLIGCEQSPLDASFRPRKLNNSRSGVSGFVSSPFPELDNFIRSIIIDDLVTGFIRKWNYFSNEQRIIYDIGNYRYCGNIGRHHKSNNIRIVVDMAAKCYYQICLDPDCRQESYQSQSRTLPESLSFIKLPDDFFDEDCFSQLQAEQSQKVDLQIQDGDATYQAVPLQLQAEDIQSKENHYKPLFRKHSLDVIVKSTQRRKILSDISNSKIDDYENKDLNRRTLYDEPKETNCNLDFLELCFESAEEDGVCAQVLPYSDFNECVPGAGGFGENGYEDQINSESWDGFFGEAFTFTQETHKEKQEENTVEDCSLEPDSTLEASSISFEDEVLMAVAAETAEFTMDENVFSEETIF